MKFCNLCIVFSEKDLCKFWQTAFDIIFAKTIFFLHYSKKEVNQCGTSRDISFFIFKNLNLKFIHIALFSWTSELRELVTKLATLQANRANAYTSPKILKYYKQDPSCCFLIVEASLTKSRIKNKKTKTQALIAQLDPEIFTHVQDIINSQPLDMYKKIKDRTVTTYLFLNKARLH